MWFNLSALRSSGEVHDMAIKGRDHVATKMTPAEIDEAEVLAQEWLKKHQTPD
jgi:hypothetical protein